MANPVPEPRKGMPGPRLDEARFRQRFLSRFVDPALAPMQAELDRLAGAAWDAYSHERKSPKTEPAVTIPSTSTAGSSRLWSTAMSRAPKTSGAASPTGCASRIWSPAGISAELDRYIGDWKPYATGHEELDADLAIQAAVRKAALTLAEAAHANHAGKLLQAGRDLKPPLWK